MNRPTALVLGGLGFALAVGVVFFSLTGSEPDGLAEDADQVEAVDSQPTSAAAQREYRALAREIEAAAFREAVGEEAWSSVVRQGENFHLGASKIRVVTGSETEEISEADAALVALIEEAIEGRNRPAAFAALAERDMPLEPVDEANIKAALLAPEHRERTLSALVEAELLPSAPAAESANQP